MNIRAIEEKVSAGRQITRHEAAYLSSRGGEDIFALFAAAGKIRNRFRKNRVDLCSIINAKSGACSEDCSYCAQSAKSRADIQSFALLEKAQVLEKALEAKQGGARRFCVVTSGKKPSARDLGKIADMVSGVRQLGLLPCSTLGLLSGEDLALLKDAGLERYHHNLETSERFFPEICTTHTYQDKIRTIRDVLSLGLSLCAGGIFGLGETWEDRIEMAFALRKISPDSVPINFLTPIRGTRLGSQRPLAPLEALKIISLYRFILPDKEIRVCGGRIQTLGDFNSFIFFAGADGLLIGNYLTTLGRNMEHDLKMIEQMGLKKA